MFVECLNGYDHFISINPDPALALYHGVWVGLLGDSPLGLKPRRLVADFDAKLSKCYTDIAREYAKLAEELVVFLATGHEPFHSYPDDVFERITMTPIVKEIVELRKNPNNARLHTYVYGFLRLGKKTVYSGTEQLEHTALRKWLDVESKLDGFVLPEYAPSLRVIMGEIIKSASDTGRLEFVPALTPSHGSGAVAQEHVHSRVDKDSNFVISKRLLLAVDNLMQRTGAKYGIRSILPERARIVITELACSVLQFVPKDVFTMRSICKEPVGFMFFQQDVMRSLVRLINASSIRPFIHFEDQEHNAHAALMASSSCHLTTLDSSMASDSVHGDLVKAIFPSCVYLWLAVTRTTMVRLPNGEIRKVNKFAPMGSSTCFPVQSLVFLSIVLLAYHRFVYGLDAKVTPKSYKELLRSIHKDDGVHVDGMETIRIYGDDLIFDTRVTSDVIRMLEEMCFTVNETKTFSGEVVFRESCGDHCFNGQSIKPFSFKPDATGEVLTSELLACVIDAANRAHDYGYNQVYRILCWFAHYRSHLDKGYMVNPRPLLYDETRGLRGPDLFNVSVKTKRKLRPGGTDIENDLHTNEYVRVIIPKVKSEKGDADPVYQYLAWQSQSYGGRRWSDLFKEVNDTAEEDIRYESDLVWSDIIV